MTEQKNEHNEIIRRKFMYAAVPSSISLRRSTRISSQTQNGEKTNSEFGVCDSDSTLGRREKRKIEFKDKGLHIGLKKTKKKIDGLYIYV